MGSEVSLALVLLIGSALLIRTFFALHCVSPPANMRTVALEVFPSRCEPLLQQRSVAERIAPPRWATSPQRALAPEVRLSGPPRFFRTLVKCQASRFNVGWARFNLR